MLRRSDFTCLSVILFLLAFQAAPASGAALLYADRAQWEAATDNLFRIDFEGIAVPAYATDYSTAGGYTMGGVQFVGEIPVNHGYYLVGLDSGTGPPYDWHSGDYLQGPKGQWGGYVQVNFIGGGVTALGSDIMTSQPYADLMVVSLSTGESFTVATSNIPNRAFVGITSDTPIQYVRFAGATGYTLVDNFARGDAIQASEASAAESLFLGGTGLLGIWLARRMRRWTA